jgi:DNA-binding Lrp family transcriptional regulator
MAVWDVPDDRVSEVGPRLGQMPEVTHCYRRPRRPPVWPYNLFAMVHGYTREEVLVTVERIARELGIADLPHKVLFSTRPLKKQGTRVQARPGRLDGLED